MLKRVLRSDSPRNVHQLRTRSRRLEAAIRALKLDEQPHAHRLLKTVARLRKKAGRVRDLDVLVGLAAKLALPGQDELLVQFIEHIGAKRRKAAGKLHTSVNHRIKSARRQLKQCRSLFKSEGAAFARQQANASSAASSLSAELASWPRLGLSNLHAYRIKVKELRYTLELIQGADTELTSALSELTDVIGDWHDWTELQAMASKFFAGKQRVDLLHTIRATVSAKLRSALSLAEAMQRRYFTDASSIAAAGDQA